MDKKMKVIPKPKEGSRVVFIKEGNTDNTAALMKGSGDLHYLCGYCETVLLEGVKTGQIKNIVFKCPICNNYNDIV